ncbi:MAG: glutamate 5-kinase [Chlamydiota bacterium]|nr:glutamate 5-kinase [Chlamydiota bacterium]
MRKEIMEKVQRVVIKIGTKAIIDKDYRLDRNRIDHIIRQIKWLIDGGREVILVSSGAIVEGVRILGLDERPKQLATLQAAAAVGQVSLMETYHSICSQAQMTMAQVLLTSDDLKDRKRHLNAKHTFEELIKRRVLTIVNENDSVSVEEITFGDNDRLSALVAILVQADLLIMLTDKDGLLGLDGELIANVPEIDGAIEKLAQGSVDWKGIGGMKSKLASAGIVVSSGESVLIANGSQENIIRKIFEKEDVGTFFFAKRGKISSKKRWLAHFIKTQGALVLDSGALAAIQHKGKSLLASGILSVTGAFQIGSLISLKDEQGCEIARGLSNYSALELEKIKGSKTSDIINVLGYKYADEVVHRNYLVVL